MAWQVPDTQKAIINVCSMQHTSADGLLNHCPCQSACVTFFSRPGTNVVPVTHNWSFLSMCFMLPLKSCPICLFVNCRLSLTRLSLRLSHLLPLFIHHCHHSPPINRSLTRSFHWHCFATPWSDYSKPYCWFYCCNLLNKMLIRYTEMTVYEVKSRLP